jgi:hypothetical protein
MGIAGMSLHVDDKNEHDESPGCFRKQFLSCFATAISHPSWDLRRMEPHFHGESDLRLYLNSLHPRNYVELIGPCTSKRKSIFYVIVVTVVLTTPETIEVEVGE